MATGTADVNTTLGTVDDTWWAVAWTDGNDEPQAVICATPTELGSVVADAATSGATDLRSTPVQADALARMAIAAAFPQPPAPSEPAVDAPGWPVTAEQAAEWTVTEWKAFLDRALITEAQACREISPLAGRTVGLADIKGHPDRAMALLTMAATGRAKAATR